MVSPTSVDIFDDSERISDAAWKGYRKRNQGEDKGYLHNEYFLPD